MPAVNSGDDLSLELATARQVFADHQLGTAKVVWSKNLEELGIGRPSTYATIINTIQNRGYAEKGESEGEPRDIIVLNFSDGNSQADIVETEKTGSDKGKLIPTAIGDIISDFLLNHFEQIVDYGFTARVEDQFDKIATGSLARNVMLDDFYQTIP